MSFGLFLLHIQFNSLVTLSHATFISSCWLSTFLSGSLQFAGGCGDVLGDLGELQVGAVHHVGLTAALWRAHGITVTGVIQTGVLRT